MSRILLLIVGHKISKVRIYGKSPISSSTLNNLFKPKMCDRFGLRWEWPIFKHLGMANIQIFEYLNWFVNFLDL